MSKGGENSVTVKSTISRLLMPMAFLVTLVLVSPMFGYEYPLSSDSIREAYSVGSDKGAKASAFIEKYTHRFPVPPSGPYVAIIQLETPYAEIVERAQQAVNYTAQDAVQEFLGRPGAFRLRVQIYFTPSYTAIVVSKGGKPMVRSDDFWRDFKISFIQDGEVRADRVRGEALYGKGAGRRTGAEVELDFNAEQIKSAPAKIEVLTPDGRKIETTFDLARMR